MDAKLFLRNKSIFNENYIYNLDVEAFELSNLLTEYAQTLQLLQTGVSMRSEQFYCFNNQHKRIDKCEKQCTACNHLKLMQ